MVLIRHHANHTLCPSSQAGCAFACAFCATGGRFRAPGWAEVKAFPTRLRALHCPVRTRCSAGKQDGMGCGQLSAETILARPPGGHVAAPPGIFTA